ncbi:MAG: Kdo hydroxylase family protein [Caulobacteraceae bacterium]
MAAVSDLSPALEREGLLVLDDEEFALQEQERSIFASQLAFGASKSASFNPLTGEARGHGGCKASELLMARYAGWARRLLETRLSRYRSALEIGRTSLRWRDAADAPRSERKDDRRLHADAFASQPTGGKRILRVFSNINPDGEPRRWRIGEPFDDYAGRWLARVHRPLPFEATLLRALGVTRQKRTPYDFIMLGLHDAAKLDLGYQMKAPRREIAFAPGASWIVFTDSLVHAAVAGRWALEQTFYLPVAAMRDEALSPLRILERMVGGPLAPQKTPQR